MSKFYLASPELEVPFDARYFGDGGDNNPMTSKSGKFSVKLQLKGCENNKAVNDFKEMLEGLDEFLMDKAIENSQQWFKKAKLTKDAINALYTPFVSVSKDRETGEPDGRFAPTFGFKVNKKENKFPDFCIYDNKKNVFDVNGEKDDPVDLLNVLVKGSLLKVVLKCNGIWIANGKFGCTWRAEQVRVKVPEGGLRDFAILSDSDDEDVEEVEAVNTSKDVSNMIEDSSEEEEKEVETEVVEAAEESEDEVKEPEPEPVKKVVKKKRAVRVKKPEA